MANVRGTRAVGDGNKPAIEKIVPSAGWTEDSTGHYLLIDLPGFKKEHVKIQLVGSRDHVKVSGERATNQNKQVRFEENYKIPADNLSLDKIAAKFEGGILFVIFPKQVEIAEKKRDETTSTTTSTATVEKKKNVSGGGDAAEEQTQQKPHGHDDEQVKKPDEQTQQKPRGRDDEQVKKPDEQTQQKPRGHDDEQVKKPDEQAQQKPRGHDDEQVKKPGDDQSHGDKGQSKKEEKLDGNCRTRLPEDSSVKKLEEEEGFLRSAMKTLNQSRGIIVTALLAFSLGFLLSRRLEPARR